MPRYLYFLLSHTIFVSYWIGVYYGGFYSFSTIFYVFGILPMLDILFGNEEYIIDKSENNLIEIAAYKNIIYSWSAIHVINVLVTLYLVINCNLSLVEIIGLGFSLGIEGGQSIAVAHELTHKHNKTDLLISRILLFLVMYNHFEIEHKQGHHINVATEKDPATAKYNQTYYNFWKQSVIGSYKNAFEIEKQKFGYSLNNLVIYYSLMYMLMICVLAFNNLQCAIFMLLQATIGFSFLEISNYFEHYGLSRKKENGEYESVKTHHSWDNDSCVSNWILFRLGRHADHHVFPYKEYQYLKPIKNAPQLITGYPGSALMCLIPDLWFYFMNPRVDKINELYYGKN
ncbi:fatty acid desaturase [Catovirus CTV1]|uniref:Fatty acid desaturase n=1 Tax=Catovirus CTV1 TaxID=1977631 RepID=A0A1V0SBK9_9VIRU|nr:fatty acid desaturase [Catovirus CTV1]